MINPSFGQYGITIEGSRERRVAGELVIDLAEYYAANADRQEKVVYYQLKHSTKRLKMPYTLSEMKGTIVGFSQRFRAHRESGEMPIDHKYTILSNRPASSSFKRNLELVSSKNPNANARFLETLRHYTGMEGDELSSFCERLTIEDGEAGYVEQRCELHGELAQLLVGSVERYQVDTLVALVADRVLPDSDGAICKEDVLQRLGCTSERDLFPAPPKIESTPYTIKRQQHDEVRRTVENANYPVVIHAEGGVGKSVFASQLASDVIAGSTSIFYDCFGSGQYRNRSEPRHRCRDALVQISNEIFSLGLCEPLVPRSTDHDDALIRALLMRLEAAVTQLRQVNAAANLVIFVDAADNAEMAAREVGEACFAHQLVREKLPDGVKLVLIARTERLELLNLPSTVISVRLEPFQYDETLSHVRTNYPNATQSQVNEFHRLTSGNPRVQANALSLDFETISDVLLDLGPNPVSVSDQIEAQLQSAVERLRDALPAAHQEQFDSICFGLANLPPYIPLEVLAAAINVDEASIKSFVSDLGRPLWLSDSSVQFRDEPTETWFRDRFSANRTQLSNFVESIRPLANRIPYVASALPALLLQVGKHEELMGLALSEEFLPHNNPIDARNIKLYRLRFAFRAALKENMLANACKLALLAGEESAGDERQLELLKQNLDLVGGLQSPQRVQDLGYRRLLFGAWDGSENVYSASLLSNMPDSKGEASAYLRSARNWLNLYFEYRDKARNEDDRFAHEEKLDELEILELATAVYNLSGSEALGMFVFSWRPSELSWRIASRLARRMIDAGRFKELEKIVAEIPTTDRDRYLFFCLAVNEELWGVGKTLPKKILRNCLNLLLDQEIQLPKESAGLDRRRVFSVSSLAEACASRGISKRKICLLIGMYTSREATHHVRSDYHHVERYEFLRPIALDCVLRGRSDFKIEELLPKDWFEEEEKKHDSHDLRAFRELVGGTFPWHLVRARLIVGDVGELDDVIQSAKEESSSALSRRYKDVDPLRFEISKVQLAGLAVPHSPIPAEIDRIVRLVRDPDSKIWLNDLIHSLRCVQRLDLPESLSFELESRARKWIEGYTEDGPTEKADNYIALARAVLPNNPKDSAAYFNDAIKVVSEFGDEMIERWEAVAAVGRRYSESRDGEAEIAFRFIRCAELIGDRVAREKYIDRDDAIVTCSMISPRQAIAALSRWRDRDVGYFDRQLRALGESLIEQKQISPAAAWALTGFEACRIDSRYASYCVKADCSEDVKVSVFEDAVNDALVQDSSAQNVDVLREASKSVRTGNTAGAMCRLEDASNFTKPNDSTNESSLRLDYRSGRDEMKVDWTILFSGLDLVNPRDVSLLLQRFDQIEPPRYPELFWKKIYETLSRTSALDFLDVLISLERVDPFDLEHALDNLPGNWKRSRAFEQKIPLFVDCITSRFAPEYCRSYQIKRLLELCDGLVEFDDIVRGVMVGLGSLPHSLGAGGFFSFVGSAIQLIPPEEAHEVLDFALTRFELHIEPEYGDGPWREDMSIEGPSNAPAIAGLLWSALASPRTRVRWEAAHSVRRLIEAGGAEELEQLLRLADSLTAGPFGCGRYPFYDLHAKMYLLIAILRVSIDDCTLLNDHLDTFLCMALDGPPHAFIRKAAAWIALRIEEEYSGAVENEKLELLKQVGVSPFPTLPRDDETRSTPWHDAGQVDTSIDLYIAFDFDRYWFNSLARVFGVTSKQIDQLVKQTIVRDWGFQPNDRSLDDPRDELWRSYRFERETWHSHGDYPKTDDYRFYLSYHAMFVVADRLLMNMPTVESDWEEDGWDGWIDRYFLTRKDGRWVADRRDPPPLETRRWLKEPDCDEWRWEILADDFLDCLLRARNGETWLVCYGSWNECENVRSEDFNVSSALVNRNTALSLLRALATCKNPHDFKTPEYLEDRVEVDEPPFEFSGWVTSPHHEVYLDKFDPHAGDIYYPPLLVGSGIAKKLGLSVDSEKRLWTWGDKDAIRSEIWGDAQPDDREYYRRHGHRLVGSLAFLKRLCVETEKDLIFEVQINRSRSYSYSRNEDDEVRYTPSYSKIYLLSGGGILRDLRKNYQLREAVS